MPPDMPLDLRQAGDTEPCRGVARGERRPKVVGKEFTLGPGKTAVLARVIARVEQQVSYLDRSEQRPGR